MCAKQMFDSRRPRRGWAGWLRGGAQDHTCREDLMPEQAQQWHQETVNVDGTDLVVIKGGAGRPLLVLHDEMGHPGWLKWHVELAKDHSLIIPLHPGFGITPRADWIWNIRDLAGFYA